MPLEAIVVQHLIVARVADGLGIAWNTANDAVLAEGRRMLIDDKHRFDGVKVIGVDEHVWGHTALATSTYRDHRPPPTHSTSAAVGCSRPSTATEG